MNKKEVPLHYKVTAKTKHKPNKIYCRNYIDIINNLKKKQYKYLIGIKGLIEYGKKDFNLKEQMIFLDIINNYIYESNNFDMKISNNYSYCY